MILYHILFIFILDSRWITLHTSSSLARAPRPVQRSTRVCDAPTGRIATALRQQHWPWRRQPYSIRFRTPWRLSASRSPTRSRTVNKQWQRQSSNHRAALSCNARRVYDRARRVERASTSAWTSCARLETHVVLRTRFLASLATGCHKWPSKCRRILTIHQSSIEAAGRSERARCQVCSESTSSNYATRWAVG